MEMVISVRMDSLGYWSAVLDWNGTGTLEAPIVEMDLLQHFSRDISGGKQDIVPRNNSTPEAIKHILFGTVR